MIKSFLFSFNTKIISRFKRIIGSAETVFATPENPFYVPGNWVKAMSLSAGMLVNTFFGLDTVYSNTPIKDTNLTVYNFTVENTHTYFVGKGAFTVHNTCKKIRQALEKITDTDVKELFETATIKHKKLADAIVDGTLKMDDLLPILNTKKLGVDEIAEFAKDFGENSIVLGKFNDGSISIESWKKLHNADVPKQLRGDAEFLKRFSDAQIPSDKLNHASAGDFTYDPASGNVSRMSGGGHGKENRDFLNQIGMEYNIVTTYPNGVMVGNVPLHKTVAKRTGTAQSWFPNSWSKTDIEDAGKYVESLPQHVNLPDGQVVFGTFKGVKVGIIKTNGNVGTIFPDNIQ